MRLKTNGNIFRSKNSFDFRFYVWFKLTRCGKWIVAPVASIAPNSEQLYSWAVKQETGFWNNNPHQLLLAEPPAKTDSSQTDNSEMESRQKTLKETAVKQ